MTVIIAAVPASEHDAFFAMLREYMAEMDQFDPDAAETPFDADLYFDAMLDDMETREFLWILEDGERAGLAIVRTLEDFPYEERMVATISEFYVAPPFRRRGVGSAAVEALLAEHRGSSGGGSGLSRARSTPRGGPKPNGAALLPCEPHGGAGEQQHGHHAKDDRIALLAAEVAVHHMGDGVECGADAGAAEGGKQRIAATPQREGEGHANADLERPDVVQEMRIERLERRELFEEGPGIEERPQPESQEEEGPKRGDDRRHCSAIHRSLLRGAPRRLGMEGRGRSRGHASTRSGASRGVRTQALRYDRCRSAARHSGKAASRLRSAHARHLGRPLPFPAQLRWAG
jgi:GNAT superfamily N-acetyltransferase